ncbi:MAG: ATP-binding cassette domain-containing protein [Cellvibrionales bacterium]|nr:ATP-binding cassette domain-containing protein [Cellvibrionales bacterium]
MEPVIRCQAASKSYRQAGIHVDVLKSINLDIMAGESIAIVGSSGAGKSTLLNLLGGLDRCDSGRVIVAGEDLGQLSDRSLSKLRNFHMGFVYQFHHLLGEFSAIENVAMPLLIRGLSKRNAFARAQALLADVDLAKRANHRPYALSGGERQRVAIARALVTEPQVVLMDEPTGNLDEGTAEKIQQLIKRLNLEHNSSFVIVTHDNHLANQQQRVLSLHEGQLKEIKKRPENKPSEAHGA